jgi:hypothetical protein
VIIFEARKWAITHDITNFSVTAQCAVTDSWMRTDCVKHKTILKSFRICGFNNGLDSTKDFVLLKKMKSWTVTIVMMNVTVVIILGNVVTSRNFVWRCYFVEWVIWILNFKFQ